MKSKTHSDVIEQWPSMPVLSKEIGENLTTVKQWKARNSIPAKFWVCLVALAQDRDIILSYRMLAEAAAKKK